MTKPQTKLFYHMERSSGLTIPQYEAFPSREGNKEESLVKRR
jgi:hypothetical protein